VIPIWRSKRTLGKIKEKYNDFTSEQGQDAQIKEEELGGHVSSFREKIYEKFWMESLMQRDRLQDLGINGRLVQKFVWN
jgi:hypothetical protein